MKTHACWSKIGTWGNGSCQELAKAVHCRNCSVYSQAAAAVLDRELPEGYLAQAEWASAPIAQTKTRGASSAVIFRIHREWLALATNVFKEVCEVRSIHSLPHQRNGVVLGIANVRGELLVCVSLSALLGVAKPGTVETAPRGKERLLVAGAADGERLVFPVDEVHGVHRYDSTDLGDAPATIAKAASTYTRAMLSWEHKSVGLLDHELLFESLNRCLS